MRKTLFITLTGLTSLIASYVCLAQSNDQTGNTDQMLQQVKQLQQQVPQQDNQSQPPDQSAPQAFQAQGPAPSAPQPPPVSPEPSPVTNPYPQPNTGYSNGQPYGSGVSQDAVSGPSRIVRPRFRAPFSSQQIPPQPGTRAVQQQAFAGTVQGLLPMTPEQIHRLRQLYTASQFAAAAPPGIPPRATATSLFVDLSPGATPPAINLAQGDITALVFLDSTGAPWPIDAYDNGNPTAFNIEWNKKDNVMMIQANASFGTGNLAVRLRGLGPPVMISLITNTAVENGGVIDYRVDMRVPGFGPNATPMMTAGLPSQTSPRLLDVLDGVPPPGGRTLEVGDSVGQAWLVQGYIFLRTRLTLLSPGWLQTMSSADGTNAYKLQSTPMLLMSQNGKVIQVKVEGL
jgi:intracellular multiplication protein IcmK